MTHLASRKRSHGRTNLGMGLVGLTLLILLALVACSKEEKASAKPAATTAPTSVAASRQAAPTAPSATEAQAKATQPPAKAEPKRGGVLLLDGDDPPSFDVHQETTQIVIRPIMPNYDGILMFDPQDPNKVVGDLAERWEQSPDGLTYTFFIRKGVKFHNGYPLTAADVKFSLERLISPPKGVLSPRQETLSAVDKVEAVDDYTVKITLKRPNPSLLPILAQGRGMAVYSKKFLEENPLDVMKKQTMGTGPYKLKEYVRGNRIELERNPDYWVSGRPYLDGIKFFIIPDAGTKLAAFRSGQLHTLGLSVSDAKAVEKELAGKIAITRAQGLGPSTVLLNTTRKPLEDVRVRQALSLAIDRNAAINVLAQGEAALGGHMPPTGVWSLPPEELAKLPGYEPDKAAAIARAKQLLSDAGYTNGFSMPLGTLSSSSSDAAAFVKDQFAKVGVQVTIQPAERAAMFDAFNKKDYTAAEWGYGFTADDPDFILPEFYVCGSVRNYTGLCDQDLERLNREQSQTLDPAKRKKLVQELDTRALNQAAVLILYYAKSRTGVWNQVKDFVVFPSVYNNVYMRDVWLDK